MILQRSMLNEESQSQQLQYYFLYVKFFFSLTFILCWSVADFTVLCEFQVYSKVIPLPIYTYPLFFRFFSHMVTAAQC